ncbi:unnamed protein product [Trichobilharzia regenti]|nr:unnamed protein product [Trichobilharzia regenti]
MSTEVLYHIWSLTSCTQPGWFTPTELVTALALIGLAQRRQWEVHSASISEAISIHSVYEQICPPVPMIKIPNNSNRQSNSTGIALGSKSISQATVGNDFQNSVVSEFSKFPFQPPVVAFSAFPQQLDISNTSQNQSVQSDSKTNSFMDFTSSTSPIVDDPEWSDFTSFSASVAPLEKDTLMNVPVIVNGQKTPVTNVNNTLFDEEFGEFQTSHSIDSLKPIEFPNAFTHSNSLLPSSNNHAPKSSSSSSTEKIISYDLDPINIQCETNSSESLRGQWLCCLNMCLKVFNQSISVLSSLETPKDRKEFAESEEGSDFLLGMFRVY